MGWKELVEREGGRQRVAGEARDRVWTLGGMGPLGSGWLGLRGAGATNGLNAALC